MALLIVGTQKLCSEEGLFALPDSTTGRVLASGTRKTSHMTFGKHFHVMRS